MNVDSRIDHLKREIELNLHSMHDQNMSNEMFCQLMDDNATKMDELTSLYKEKSKELDKKMEEFSRGNLNEKC